MCHITTFRSKTDLVCDGGTPGSLDGKPHHLCVSALGEVCTTMKSPDVNISQEGSPLLKRRTTVLFKG